MTHIYDISRTLSPALAVWPGDMPFSFTHSLRLRDGASVNLTTLTLSAHTGSHIDAPYHYVDVSIHPADLPLAPYIGPAHVVTIARRQGGHPARRFRRARPGRDAAPADPYLGERFARRPVARRFPLPDRRAGRLAGRTGGSPARVGRSLGRSPGQPDAALPSPAVRPRIANLENVRLAGVPDGVYELIALPLKIAGICGSPVRAILRGGAANGMGCEMTLPEISDRRR